MFHSSTVSSCIHGILALGKAHALGKAVWSVSTALERFAGAEFSPAESSLGTPKASMRRTECVGY